MQHMDEASSSHHQASALALKREQLRKLREENHCLKEKVHKLSSKCAVDAGGQPRLASLDVCRGLATVAAIVVKYAGTALPAIDYVPWNGIHLADFGAPLFLFLVGVSIALAYSNVRSRFGATQTCVLQSAWLSLVGVLLEGGFFHGRADLSFGVDIGRVRWFGTLQRIALAYFIVALCAIWAPQGGASGSAHRRHYLQWGVTALMPAASIALLYGIYVPDWQFYPESTRSMSAEFGNNTHSSISSTGSAPAVVTTLVATIANTTSELLANWTLKDSSACSALRFTLTNAANSTCSGSLSNFALADGTLSAMISNVTYASAPLPAGSVFNATGDVIEITCGVRGHLGPPCNAAGYIDRLLLGLNHLKALGMDKRALGCDGVAPDFVDGPSDAPSWCLAPFDPEGVLASLSAITTASIGLHFGRVLVRRKQHVARLWSWILPSAMLLMVGMTLHNLGFPFNRQLYSFSYMCFTAGAAGTLLSSIYLLVDAYGWTWGFPALLQCMGRHSLLMFALVGCDVLPAVLQGFYNGSPQNNLITFLRDHLLRRFLQFSKTV